MLYGKREDRLSMNDELQNNGIKKPIVFSVLLTILILVFPVVSGAIITIFKFGELRSRLIQALAFIIAGIIGCIIAKLKFGSLKDVGLKIVHISDLKDYLWFAPIILVEILPFFAGLKSGLNQSLILAYVLFTIAVGFAEELYFRGLIANSFKKTISLVLFSSFLFSIGHIMNLLAGASIFDTALQIVFAFLFGIVAVEISFTTKSLVIPILWHTAHNFISLVTASNDGKWSLIIAIAQGTILLIYGIYLWVKKINTASILRIKKEI